jgi:hypothetical protein
MRFGKFQQRHGMNVEVLDHSIGVRWPFRGHFGPQTSSLKVSTDIHTHGTGHKLHQHAEGVWQLTYYSLPAMSDITMEAA